MEMQKSVCNIVWVDDEIDTLLTDSKKRILKKEGFELIGIARTFKDFSHIMTVCYDRVDAVITDANFNSESTAIKHERDLSGLVKMKDCIYAYNQKRDIPFYLFTRRGEYLSEKYVDGELDYFEANGRYFAKGEFDELLQKIRKDVEHINSPSFRIRKKYAKELDAASLIDGNEEILMNALLYEYSEDWKNTKEHFNSMRNIADSIFSACKRNGIIPDVGELNQIGKFLGGKEHETYVITQEIIPKPLARGLWYFLDITQDASHNKEELTLKVREYVRETQNINLFRSVLYIAMDLCLWYKRSKEEAELSEFKPKWSLKEVEVKNEVQIKVCKYEGVVRMKLQNVYYCGRYLLQKPKDNKYKEGDRIRIYDDEENGRWKFKHFDDGKETVVDRFVRLDNLEVIND